jgi:hypothetical protein
MEKQTIVLVEGKFDYVLHEYMTDKGLVFELKYSNSEEWSEHVRETTVMKLRDDGNGIKIITKINQKDLDYNKAMELMMLLQQTVTTNMSIEYVKYKGHDS